MENTLKIKTRINKEDVIRTEVCIAVGIDKKTNDTKLITFRKENTDKKIELLKDIIKNLESQAKNTKDRISELNILDARKIRLNNELRDLEELLSSNYVTWSATWKKPKFQDIVAIESSSYSEDGFGNKTFDTYLNMKKRYEVLLLKWDVTDVNDKDEIIPVPIKDAMDCDPELIQAFSEELDVRLSSYKIELKK